jgi:type IV pilus assembly protein PilZ
LSGATRRRGDPRRRFRRVTVRLLVDFVAAGGVHCEYATTLGAGGLFIECEQPLAPGTRLKVRFRLPGAETLHEIEARVAWWQPPGAHATRAPGMGVEFTDAVAIAALARALERLPEGPG